MSPAPTIKDAHPEDILDLPPQVQGLALLEVPLACARKKTHRIFL